MTREYETDVSVFLYQIVKQELGAVCTITAVRRTDIAIHIPF